MLPAFSITSIFLDLVFFLLGAASTALFVLVRAFETTGALRLGHAADLTDLFFFCPSFLFCWRLFDRLLFFLTEWSEPAARSDHECRNTGQNEHSLFHRTLSGLGGY